MTLLDERDMAIVNVDVTVVAEEPRLAPYTAEMRRRLAESLRLSAERVSIKAKTNEHMGFAGRGEGLVAFAVVLLDGPNHA